MYLGSILSIYLSKRVVQPRLMGVLSRSLHYHKSNIIKLFANEGGMTIFMRSVWFLEILQETFRRK